MKKIQLGGHRFKSKPVVGFALVDDEDFDYINQWKWSVKQKDSTNYAHRSPTNEKATLMHRVILKAKKGQIIDHIDRNGLNNQKSNLRIVTHAQNLLNSRKRSNNTSGYKGVSFNKQKRTWEVQISVGGERRFLGRFKDKEKAYSVYCLAAVEYQKEFTPDFILSTLEGK